jgi:RNA polymerase sigma factor (sigma-70 family)
MVAALENPPPAHVPVRPWLARVARNVSIDRLRRAVRRRRHERRAARADATPSTGALAERVAWQQRVVAAVLALDAPYRTVVLLRYYEDLPPRRIAGRLGIPVNTVRSRLRRAHALLRGRLDREHGGRATWSVALLPLLARPAAPVLTMKAMLVLLAALLGSVGLLARFVWEPPSATPARVPLAAANAPAPAPPTAAHPGASFATGTLVGALPAECEAAGGVRAAFRGGTELRLRPGPFRLAYDGPATLVLSGPGVRPTTYDLPAGGKDLGRVVIERAVSYGGRVLDLKGRPLCGATVYWGKDRLAEAVTADGDGAFRLEVPPEIKLTRDADGFLTAHLLYVRRGRAWAGPFWAHPTGFRLGHDLRIQLEEPPTLRFVHRNAPANVSVALCPVDTPDAPLALPEATDADGCVRPDWPPWVESALVRIEEPEGDTVLAVVPLGDVVSNHPYEIDLAQTAAVRLPVVEADGKTPAVGIGVRVAATWVPVGWPPTDVLLPGRTNDAGETGWRFVAEEPDDGVLHVHTVVLDDARGARPARTTLGFMAGECTAANGGLLPPARLQGSTSILLAVTPTDAEPQAMWMRGLDAAGEKVSGDRVMFTAARRDLGLWFGRLPFDGLPAEVAEAEVFASFSGPRLVSLRVDRSALLEAMAGKRTLALVVPPKRRGRIRVIDAEGRPVAAAELRAYAPAVLPMSSQSVTGSDGRAVFGIDPSVGPWSVTVHDPRTLAGVRVAEWWAMDREQTVTLEQPQDVRFRVLREDGTPAAFATVTVTGMRKHWTTCAEQNGWCRIQAIAPGLYKLGIWAADSSTREFFHASVSASEVGPDRPVTLKRYDPSR